METLNIGDSGYLILRRAGGKLEEIFRSKDQVHSFNLPFQVGTNGDSTSCANHCSHVLLPGDIIVLASDGLWDNVYTKEISHILEKYLIKRSSSSNLNEAAKELVIAAQENAENT